MSVISLTKNSFNTEVMNSDKPVLIDFFATWCGPCRMLSPIIDEISEENADIKVCKVNVDEEPELAQAFGVRQHPDCSRNEVRQACDKVGRLQT